MIQTSHASCSFRASCCPSQESARHANRGWASRKRRIKSQWPQAPEMTQSAAMVPASSEYVDLRLRRPNSALCISRATWSSVYSPSTSVSSAVAIASVAHGWPQRRCHVVSGRPRESPCQNRIRPQFVVSTESCLRRHGQRSPLGTPASTFEVRDQEIDVIFHERR
jgi:hypothetical protein